MTGKVTISSSSLLFGDLRDVVHVTATDPSHARPLSSLGLITENERNSWVALDLGTYVAYLLVPMLMLMILPLDPLPSVYLVALPYYVHYPTLTIVLTDDLDLLYCLNPLTLTLTLSLSLLPLGSLSLFLFVRSLASIGTHANDNDTPS